MEASKARREGRKPTPIPSDIKNYIGELVIGGYGYDYIRKAVYLKFGVKFSTTKLQYNHVKTFNKPDSLKRPKQLNKLSEIPQQYKTIAYVDMSYLSTESIRDANKEARRFFIEEVVNGEVVRFYLMIGTISTGSQCIIKTWISTKTGELKEYFTELLELAFTNGLKFDAVIVDTNYKTIDKNSDPVYHKPIFRIKKNNKNPYNWKAEQKFTIKDTIYPFIPYLSTLTIQQVKDFTDNHFKVQLVNLKNVSPIYSEIRVKVVA